jgi:hypothetical protein
MSWPNMLSQGGSEILLFYSRESLRYPARFGRKLWCRLRNAVRRLRPRVERCIADG